MREQMSAGTLPRLTDTQRQIEDMGDDLVLRRTLYGTMTASDLTEEQAAEMVEAARRRRDRQQQAINRIQALIDLGAAPRKAADPLREELALRERTLELAERRATLMRELAEIAATEKALLAAQPELPPGRTIERSQGKGTMSEIEVRAILLAFERHFGKPMPVSAWGDTATHRLLGFDHRGRVDVALNPDQPEGVWLRQHLLSNRIPYYAFRAAIPGKATAPHIHLGPPSLRYARATPTQHETRLAARPHPRTGNTGTD